jgi:hypothetical protein
MGQMHPFMAAILLRTARPNTLNSYSPNRNRHTDNLL